MRIVTVVGARPQFIKAAPVSRALRERHEEILVHTGQHYDQNMSGRFFDELGIPAPDFSLEAGSGAHGAQTGLMLERIERVLLDTRPDFLLVYGDTNSTLAGALAAAKLHVPIVHVEAGLRSYNTAMPEEINRVLTDRLSTILLCPSNVAATNLAAEGITNGVRVVGDVMLDAVLDARSRSGESSVASRLGLSPGNYLLATVHRAENTNDAARFGEILRAFAAAPLPVLFPVHPRTRSMYADLLGALPAHVHCVQPLGYLELVSALSHAHAVVTDSGGLQKEAYWLEVPCITVRDQTEWVETVDEGWNTLAGASAAQVLAAISAMRRPSTEPIAYGAPGASSRVVDAIEQHASATRSIAA